jgi:hypothetical protein
VTLLVTVSLGTTGATSATPDAQRTAAQNTVPSFDHVVVIVMENHEYETVIGSPAAPYVNKLAGKYGLATAFYGITHPSLPDYLALTGGSTFGIKKICTNCYVSASNLPDQLEAAGLTWHAYLQSMPSDCYTGASFGTYRKRQNPFVYYTDIVDDPPRCTSHVSPLKQLAHDLANHALARFSWITPNLCNNMHPPRPGFSCAPCKRWEPYECAIAHGDGFLKQWVPLIMAQLGVNGVIFLTWDEGKTDSGCCKLAAGGHIPTLVFGPGAATSTQSGVELDHYSILRTIEDAWGLARLRHAACGCTRDMASLLDGS